jgi:signal transduction histidine kinase
VPYWTIPLFAAIANTILCVVVYRHAPRNKLNRVFALTTVTIIAWNLNLFCLAYLRDAAQAYYWSKVFRTGTLLMPPTVVHTFLVFGDNRSRWARRYLIIAYGLVAALIIANAFDQLVSGVRNLGEWGYYPVQTRLYMLHTMSVVMNFIVACTLLVLNLKHAPSAQKRLQAQFWLLGAGVGIVSGTLNLLPVYHIDIPPLGNLGNVAYTGIVAYAIVRHRLMDIDVVITKGMGYAAGAFGLIAPAWGALLVLQQHSFGAVHRNFSFALLVVLVTVAVLFPRLRLRAESKIQRSLFREKHEYRTVLDAFTRSIVSILDRDKLVHELTTTLSETLRLDCIAIALADESKRAFVLQESIGRPPENAELQEDDEFIVVLGRRQESTLKEELEASEDRTDRYVAEVCRRNGWEVCIPLTVGGKLIGFIALGRKRNREAYFAEDLDLLSTLAASTSVALENARLYDELKKSQDIIRRADRLSALGTLAAGIAHEVRNPLVSIQTFFQLAPDRLDEEEFRTTFLSMAASEVKRISDLITELLSFARSPTRSLGSVSLNELGERVVTLLDPEARKHKVELRRQFSPNLSAVLADADQVKQVLINLVLNAIQATQAGGQVSVTTRATQRGTSMFGQIEIRDTGVGIPKEQLADIFNPFFTTKDKGTGLGLAIAHQIIMEHGGFNSVDSNEGVGTTFLVDLPAYEQGTEPVEVDALGGLYRLRKVAS